MTVVPNACDADSTCNCVGQYYDYQGQLVKVYECAGECKEYFAATGQPVLPPN